MCPPVAVHLSREGVSYLYTFWLYELQHGCWLNNCFACFKAAFLKYKDSLESEEWEEEEWDFMEQENWSEDEEESSESEINLELQEEDSGPSEVPTQPVSLLPKGEDWTQDLPWKVPIAHHCTHWPCPLLPSSPPQLLPSVARASVEPMVLELGAVRPVEPWEAEAWLLGLEIFLVVGYEHDVVIMRNLTPVQALRNPGWFWKLLLEPTPEVWMAKHHNPYLLPYLFQHPLGILERTQHNHQMCPAFTVLQKKGFIVLSFLPWCLEVPGEKYSASAQ
ncbi:testis-expressed protein 19.2-like [Cavia porcellus]|uniref:testis-expressed protein 19.2-like n=1 Tax=Cavia porcellus TaxID=10141 RepID=UPI002FE1436D